MNNYFENLDLEKRLKTLKLIDYTRLKQILVEHRGDFEKYSFNREVDSRRIPSDVLRKLGNEDIEILISSEIIGRLHGSEYAFQFRIHYIDRKDFDFSDDDIVIITTDFPLNFEKRVFPWVDEGKLMLKEIHSKISSDTLTILNMCCGAGTIAILLMKLLKRRNLRIEGIDRSHRAIAIATFNQHLNGIDNSNMQFSYGNMFEELSDAKYDLIVADPPFALQPPGMQEYEHSHGGEHGDAVIKLFLKDVKQHLDLSRGQFFLLAYSLGNPANEDIKKQIKIRELLENNDLNNAQIQVLPKDQPVWRFGDRKQVAINPMPVQYISIRCGDPTYRIAENPDEVDKYIKWIEERLVGKGWTHLHYLIVHYSSLTN
jgi:methylase of polypeptide subunit release factors